METPVLFIFAAGLAQNMLTHSWDSLAVLHTHLYLVSFCLGLLAANKHSLKSLLTTTVINRYYPANKLQAIAREHDHCSPFPWPGGAFLAYFPQLYRSQQKQVLVFIFGVQGARRCG